MINALSYGAPPHGGIAPGVDRIVMLLADKKNIREVTLFPMNQNAQDLMMDAPSNVDEAQLKDLGIKLEKKKNLFFVLRFILTSDKSTNFSSKLLLTKPLDVIFFTIFKNLSSSSAKFSLFLAIEGV